MHYYKGVAIDAQLAFQQPDLAWFTATVEATGVGEAHEILYRKNWFKILAYAGLAGLMSVLLFLAGAQVQGEYIEQWLGGPAAWGLVLFIFLITTIVAALLLASGRGFRYIYAVEQFKRFHASAQWVAYDAAIFKEEGVPEKYLAELHRQVIAGGFGLLEILPERKVRDVIEPSHLDQFGDGRKRLPLWLASLGQNPKLKGVLQSLPFPTNPAPAASPTTLTADNNDDPLAIPSYLPTRQRLRPDDYLARAVLARPGRPKFYARPDRKLAHLRWAYRNARRNLLPKEIRRLPGYYSLPAWYALVASGTVVALLALILLQASWSPLARPGSRFAAPDLAGLEPAASPAESLADPNLLPGEYDHYFTADSLYRGPDYLETGRTIVAERVPENVARYYIAQDGSTYFETDCVALTLLPDTYYLLVAGRYPTFESALAAAEDLNGVYQLAVTVTNEECLTLGGGTYYVLLDGPLVEEAQADFLVGEYLRRLELGLEVLVVE